MIQGLEFRVFMGEARGLYKSLKAEGQNPRETNDTQGIHITLKMCFGLLLRFEDSARLIQCNVIGSLKPIPHIATTEKYIASRF